MFEFMISLANYCDADCFVKRSALVGLPGRRFLFGISRCASSVAAKSKIEHTRLVPCLNVRTGKVPSDTEL